MAGLAERIVFVIGCHRSGTNWVTALLSEHPDAVRVTPELLGLTAGCVSMESAVFLSKWSDSQIRAAFKLLPKDKVLIEKTVGHVHHLKRMKRIFPDCMLVKVEREPVDVVWSLMKSTWPKGVCPMSFEDAVDYYAGYRKACGRFGEWTHEVSFRGVVHFPQEEVCRLLERVGLRADWGSVANAVRRAGWGQSYPKKLRGFVRSGLVGEGYGGLTSDQIMSLDIRVNRAVAEGVNAS